MERSPSRPVRIGFDDLLHWSSRARLILSLLCNGLRRRAICGFTTIRPYVRFQPKHPHEVQAGAQELSDTRKPLRFGAILFFGIVFSLGTYFTFASVQGNFGLFRRIQIEADAKLLQRDIDALKIEVADLQNKTRRLSDDYLDLDLLDQQARDVLGLARGDEVVIR